MTNAYATSYPKFRYHLNNGPGYGTVAPIKWDIKKVNEDVEINGGIFLCMKEGWYQFSAGIGAYVFIGVYFTVNSRHKSYASGKDNVNVSYMIKLKMHDMIYIEKVKDGRADPGGSQKHFI